MPKAKPEPEDDGDALQWPVARNVLLHEIESRGFKVGRFCKEYDLPTSTVYDAFDPKKTDVRFSTLQMILKALGWNLVRLGREMKAATAA